MFKLKKISRMIMLSALLGVLSCACMMSSCDNNIDTGDSKVISNNSSNNNSNNSEDNITSSDNNSNISEADTTTSVNSENTDNNSKNTESDLPSEDDNNTSSEILSSDVPIKNIDDENMGGNNYTHNLIPISTDNENFNKFFSANSIDAKFCEELKYCNSTAEMLSKTSEYAQAWYNAVFNGFDMLVDLLDGQDEQIQKLNSELEAWTETISETLNEYEQEAKDNGGSTINMLEAANKIMLFYRNQASEYYKQVYELIGEFNLSI